MSVTKHFLNSRFGHHKVAASINHLQTFCSDNRQAGVLAKKQGQYYVMLMARFVSVFVSLLTRMRRKKSFNLNFFPAKLESLLSIWILLIFVTELFRILK